MALPNVIGWPYLGGDFRLAAGRRLRTEAMAANKSSFEIIRNARILILMMSKTGFDGLAAQRSIVDGGQGRIPHGRSSVASG